MYTNGRMKMVTKTKVTVKDKHKMKNYLAAMRLHWHCVQLWISNVLSMGSKFKRLIASDYIICPTKYQQCAPPVKETESCFVIVIQLKAKKHRLNNVKISVRKRNKLYIFHFFFCKNHISLIDTSQNINFR